MGELVVIFFSGKLGDMGEFHCISPHMAFFFKKKHFTILKYCLFNKGNDNDVSKLVLGKVLLQLPHKLLFSHKCS